MLLRDLIREYTQSRTELPPAPPARPVPQTHVCPKCKMESGRTAVEQGAMICPACGAYFRMNARERITHTFDAGSFQELDADVTSVDFLSFPGYAEKLEKVVEEYREGIEKGEDKFNRTLLPDSFEAPFYAIYMTADLRHTQGGLVTDVAAHVLTEDNEVIQGLYAAGGVTEGFSTRAGADYMSGNGLLQALVFGKIAGERAATETRGSQEYVPYTGTGLDNYKD